MTVRCPRCSTQYRVPENRLKEADPVFRCARCKTVFSTAEEAQKKKRPRRGKADSEDPPNLAFDFQPESDENDAESDEPAFVGGLADSPRDEQDPEAAPEVEPAARPQRAAASSEDKATPASDDESEDPGWADDAPWEENAPSDAFDPSAEAEADEDADFGDEDDADDEDDAATDFDDEVDADDEDEIEEPPPARPRVSRRPPRRAPVAPQPRRERRAAPSRHGRSPLRPVGWSVAILCLLYAGTALTFSQRPEVAREALAQIPVIGKLLQQDHLLAWRIELRDLRGGPDTIKGNKVAWVVTGRAVNHTDEDVRLVEIEGELMAGGKARATRRVYAANQAVDTIRDLSISEVDMLLRLEPNRRFRIAPGESASFLLVFPNPPADTSEVVCRVVDARTS